MLSVRLSTTWHQVLLYLCYSLIIMYYGMYYLLLCIMVCIILIHLPSAVRALIFVARRIQPFLSLVDREVEFCVLTN